MIKTEEKTNTKQVFQATIKDGCSLGVYISIPSDLFNKSDYKRRRGIGVIDDIPFTGIISYVIPFGEILVLKQKVFIRLDKKTGETVSVLFYDEPVEMKNLGAFKTPNPSVK